MSLPPSVSITGAITSGTSYLAIQTSGVPAGYDITNQMYGGWCVQSDVAWITPEPVVVIPYSTYGALPPLYASKPWDKINWLINHKATYLALADRMQVQLAIWALLGGSLGPKDIVANQAYNDAMAHGGGFVPGPGEVVAVLLDAGVTQDSIIEVPVPPFGTIGDTVWLDGNHNGIQDSGEAGINGVTVRLKDASGAVVATAVTATAGAVQGQYLFTNLLKGTYSVEVDLSSPALLGRLPTATLAGPDRSIDSNPSPYMVVLPDNRSEDRTIDFGFQSPCTGIIGDLVWSDYNRNGVQDPGEPGIPNVTLNLYDAALALRGTTTTSALGLYSFGGVCAGTYTVKVEPASLPAGFTPSPSNAGGNPATDSNGSPASVTLPADNSTDSSIDFGYLQPCNGVIGDFIWHDLNRNGIQDNGEPGIDGVTVLLKSGGVTVNTATTAGGGFYRFSGVCAGAYAVELTGVPAGFTNAVSSAPGSTTDNDSNPAPAPVTLTTPDSSNLSIDFGFVGACSGSIGDFVWRDVNRNGVQDAGEPGWPGITVNLRRGSDNTLLATAYTDTNGKYLFSAQCTGSYTVEVVPPAGYAASPAGQGSTATDSNPNPAPVNLTNDVASDLTIDFGYYGGSLGDTVWNDANGNKIQDAGEPGIGGWTVQISGPSLPGGYITTRQTSVAGLYTFDNLPAGEYRVCVTPASGWAQTYDLDGLATPHCATRILSPGENAVDVDFGYVQLPTATCVNITAFQNTPITPVTMTGAGGTGAPYHFTATGLPTGLTISDAGTISGTPTETGTFNYTVTIKDKDGNTGTANCSVTVAAPPSATCVTIAAVKGSPITPVTMTGAGGTGAPYHFTATGLPTGLTISDAGTISGTPTETGTFNYTVTIKDKDGNTGTANCSVTVAAPPSATCVTIAAVKGAPITPVTLTGAGGTGAPYHFTATGLPTGLTISDAGTISGTPTETGTFNYTVTIKDKDGNTGTANCSVTVAAPPSATCVTIVAVKGSPITPVTMIGAGGTGAPYHFTATGLPTGLTISDAGTISGTPTETGTFNYTVTIKDKDGNTGAANCSVTVAAPPSATCVTIAAVKGSPITPVTMTGAGGTGAPYHFTATGLPNGLAISDAGTISGTPTETGTFNYTVTIKDKDGNTGTANCSVTVAAPPSATCVTIVAVKGSPITPVTMTGAGGTGAPYHFTATGLPNGLTISDAGTISGTPTETGTFNYTVTIKDKDGNTGTANCSVTVAAPPSATCVTIVAVKGSPITPVTLTGAGGTGAPYHFTATGLPTGLTISDAGTISGTPTVSGTFNYTVTIKDKDGNTGTANCSVTVAAPPSATCVTIAAVKGSPITPVTMTGVGGTGAPYHFTATGLPNGLAISDAGTISGTPTETGTFNYTVTIKDKDGNTGTANCSVTVTAPPSATCVTIAAVKGTPITPVTLTGAGGTGAPYHFTATGLPNGLTISDAGTISGTPTVSGTFNYTVTIKDKDGNSGTLNCSVTVSPQPVCVPTTFDLTGGNSSTNGAAGNLRAFTAANNIQVKASGWSRDKSTGAWSQAWLGAYPLGLGVTDSSEDGSDPSHRVDNVGSRVNYVLFEFSSPVIVNRVYLDAVGADSDLSVWVGTAANPFANHLTLNDALLAGFGTPEQNATSSSGARWADINGVNVSGNVLVVAASTSDWTRFDEFKIAKIETQCNTTPGTPTASCVVINAVQGTAIAPVTMSGSGGAGGPYTFSATGLPSGLTMASNGTISGTPGVSGTFPYTVTVKDKNGVAGTVTCSVTVSPAAICAPTSFNLTGNTANSGTAGNLRTFTASNGLQVKASAWARNKSNGAWTKAFLGSYSSGLGVTDNTESGDDPTHRVDNDGQVNYVLFEFSAPVKVDRVLLDYIGGDSDMAVWIGTQNSPFTNHLTLSDALLTSLGTYEENTSTVTSGSRWANINGGYVQGNVLVVAALPSGSGDYFKISKLETACVTGITGNCVSITALQGVAITPVTLTASGGSGGPYTFSATGLPSGLAISTSGTISGTPTVSGTFNYTVVVKDSAGNSSSINCSVTVTGAPSTACVSITAVQGAAITPVVLAGTGGAGGPYTFSASGLPAGLVMSSAGTISGKPTVSGTFTYTVTVTDKNGNRGTASCVVAVAPNICGLSWGFWKNHVSEWPVDTLVLGKSTYSKTELQGILGASAAGDASVNLAHQLIAAKFNTLQGTDIASAGTAITTADNLLITAQGSTSSKLPYRLSSSSTLGAQMVAAANTLNTFNSDGKAQPGCIMISGGCVGSIGNYVWVDANINGRQDLGEVGLAGVTVKLYDDRYNLVRTTTTNASGQYQFTGLCAGAYIVVVVPPSGYAPTFSNVTGSDKDSNQSPTTVVLTTDKSSNQDVDYGFVKTNCSGVVGNFVWKDSNGNGIQDSGEPGIQGVLVSLLTTGGTLLETDVTDANGAYQFNGLCAATYSVSATVPPGYVLTTTHAGSDRSKDSNPNPTTVSVDTNSDSDVTVDFGFKAVTGSATAYTTYTQGGWGAPPNGKNAASLLQANFSRVYTGGSASIGGTLKLTFTSPVAIQGFLPQGGTPGTLSGSSLTDPTTTPAGVFAGQVLALDLAVDFSNAGITKTGLANLKCASGKLAGQTITQVLAIAHRVLGGDLTALPSGVTLSDLNSIIDTINQNFDGGTINRGYLL